jgi:hypothetical protein
MYGATPVQFCSQFFEVSCTEAQQIIWIEIAAGNLAGVSSITDSAIGAMIEMHGLPVSY